MVVDENDGDGGGVLTTPRPRTVFTLFPPCVPSPKGGGRIEVLKGKEEPGVDLQ